jgi:hypothetical protein
VTFIGPTRFVVSDRSICSGVSSLEEAGIEVAGVVDQHVDAAEPLERRPHRRLRRRETRNVEPGDEQVASLADRFGHGFGVAAGRDGCMAGPERGLRDVDAHAAASASDEPNPLVSHLLQSLLAGVVRAKEATPVTEGSLGRVFGNVP